MTISRSRGAHFGIGGEVQTGAQLAGAFTAVSSQGSDAQRQARSRASAALWPKTGRWMQGVVSYLAGISAQGWRRALALP